MDNFLNADLKLKLNKDNRPKSSINHYIVKKSDLPLSCPMPNMSAWNSHPKVYLPIEEAENFEINCPYCGNKYILKEENDLK